ncbi:MAG: hypothetical protein K2X29_03420 [Candidatus Obscuribacterales bacterium]|nr:hypothetical protein [Candidatus Obscuribacterales bacterium]
MQFIKQLSLAVVFIATLVISAQQIRAAEIHYLGTIVEPSGRSVEFVLDPTGNLVDAGGNVLVNVSGVRGYVFDPDAGTIIGRLDTTGNVIALGGGAFVMRPNSRFVVLDPASRQMTGIIDTSGRFMPFSIASARTVITLPATGIGFLVDPVSLKVKGTMSTEGRLFDTHGFRISHSDAVGFVVVDPSTGFIKGYISKDKRFVAYTMLAPTAFAVMPRKAIITRVPTDTVLPTDTVISKAAVVPVETVVTPTETVITREITPGDTVISRKTVITKTVTNAPVATAIVPAGQTLIAVEPVTGEILGTLDSSMRLPSGIALSSGTIVIEKASGNAIGVINDEGTMVAIESAPVSTRFMTSLNNLRLELDKSIATGLANGTLTAEEAVKLRNDLERVAALDAASKTSPVTFVQALPLANEMRVLERRVIATTPTVVAPRLIIVNGKIRFLDEMGMRGFELQERIKAECALGKISIAERDALLERMNNIAAIEATYRADGNLDIYESRKLFTAFDRVGSALDSYIAERH